MLKPKPTTTNYIFILVGSGFSSSRGCRGRDLRGMVNYYNLLLYNVAATSAALLLYALYELLVVMFLCCKTRRKMLSSIGLASHPYSDFLPLSPLYIASHFHLIQMHKGLLVNIRLAGMLDTHPCFPPSSFVSYTRPV